MIQVRLVAAAAAAATAAASAAVIGISNACTPIEANVAAAPAPRPADGQLPLPAGYRNWPKFLSAIQRDDVEQVREIYLNPLAHAADAAKGFPNGSVLVMESYDAATHPDGGLRRGTDGLLVKGRLVRIFVMGKNEGWGAAAPAGMRTGDWLYASYLESGHAAPNPTESCRGCHRTVADKDFVYRMDEYLAKPVS